MKSQEFREQAINLYKEVHCLVEVGQRLKVRPATLSLWIKAAGEPIVRRPCTYAGSRHYRWGFRKEQCVRGHVFDRPYIRKNGVRQCRECHVLHAKEQRQENKKKDELKKKIRIQNLKRAEAKKGFKWKVLPNYISNAFDCPECLGEGLLELGKKLIECTTCHGTGRKKK